MPQILSKNFFLNHHFTTPSTSIKTILNLKVTNTFGELLLLILKIRRTNINLFFKNYLYIFIVLIYIEKYHFRKPDSKIKQRMLSVSILKSN